MSKVAKKLEEMPFFKEVTKKGEALICIEKFNSWLDGFVDNICLLQPEKELLDQGLLEVNEKNFSPIDPSKPGGRSFYLIKSLEKTLLQQNELLRQEFNFFNSFLDELFKETSNIDFQRYELTEDEKKHFEKTSLIPCKYVYKKQIKIVCLLDDSNENVYFVGFSPKHLHSLRSGSFLSTIMQEHFQMNLMYKNPLFFSLEMDLKDVATLLGYSIKKLSDLLDDGTIYSRGALVIAELNPTFEKRDDPRKIPLQELYVYIKESNDENKEEKIDALLDYMVRTSKAIVGELESSKIPHPLSGNVDFLSLKKRHEDLKNDNEDLKLKLEDSKTATSDNREGYISIAIPEIVEIVKKVEVDIAEKTDKKFKLITQKDFLDKLKEHGDCPINGETIAKLIFQALPQKYRRKRGH